MENRQLEAMRGRRVSAEMGDADVLLRRAKRLLQEERLIVEMTLAGRLSRRQIGEALGVPGGTITRRLQRIMTRLSDPLVIALLDESCPLGPDYRQLGVEHFLQGQPIGALADVHQMRRLDVVAALNFVRGWHKGMLAHAQRNWRMVATRA